VQRDLKPPLAALGGPITSTEGGAVTFSAAGSVDPNGTIVGHVWSFGDGGTATGAVVSHTFAQDGDYAVVLTVTDNDGLTDVATTTIDVANVPPIIDALAEIALTVGDTATLPGSFTDPGLDVWTATIDWGDGSGPAPLALTGTTFTASHPYAAPGSFTATVRISDDHATATRTALITVAPRPPAVADALALVAQLAAAHKLGTATAALLTSELRGAQTALDRGNNLTALIWLRAITLEVNLLTALRILPAADAAPLQAALAHLIQSLNH
jgi:PKD repeat protein